MVQSAPANGTTSVNTANGVVTYTPALNFNGLDQFSYVVSNSEGVISSLTMVSVTVLSVNDAPVAANDTAIVGEDSTGVIDVLLNDSDVDGESEIDASSVVISVPPTHGQAEVADGKITYTPESDY